ncbi:MAG: hypothetical protein HN842_03940 [Gammaproteobacteria bacterium]|jgi:hypothetical protein|nr:hypothetical protein [Gammaproteobacteria bacterium]MBT7307341.1 hypothetical protein [Gammaproteobacteria bacterium]
MKTTIRITSLFIAAGLFCTTTASAQWFGPWGNENDLATAWGLEPSTLDDPDEGPGETIDYNTIDPPFNMNVGSGSNHRQQAAPRQRIRPMPVAPTIAVPKVAPPKVATKAVPKPPSVPVVTPRRKPQPPSSPRTIAKPRIPLPPPRANRFAPPPRPNDYYRQRAADPRQYGYRPPRPPMPFYAPPPFPPIQAPRRAPYPYYRR